MGHDHHHDHGPAPRATLRVRTVLTIALVPFFVATAVGLVVLWPSNDGRPLVDAPELLDTSTIHDATVITVDRQPCQGFGPDAFDEIAPEATSNQCITVRARLDDGPEQDQEIDLPTMVTGGIAPDLRDGDRIVVARTEIPTLGDAVYNYADVQRRGPLLLLGALFVVVVIGIARLRGLSALIGLAITLGLLMQFILPSILEGNPPILVALVGSSASMMVILYLTHGVSARTAAALLGTLVSLGITAGLAAVFLSATRITGQSEDENVTLYLAGSRVTITGLLLAGIIIGALGVLNDVTVTQASAVWELHRTDPTLGARDVYHAVMRIGRDHIASVVDTLVLAYAGASLPLLVLFSVAGRSLGTVVNGEILAIEILRTLVGSIGLVLSVPITTALAAVAVTRSAAERGDSIPSATEPPVRRATQRAQARLALAADKRRARKEAEREIKEGSWQPGRAERDFWTETSDDDA
jgi:uncharacterized membrane protein